MAEWNGTLATNLVYNTLHNGFEYVETVADQLFGLSSSVADKYMVDAGSYNTDHVFTDFDLLKSYKFDPDDTNVLQPGDKVIPQQEYIRVDKMRQINLYQPTEFLAKLPWMSEGSYSQFNGVVTKTLHDTKKAYSYLLGMTSIGTLESSVGKQQKTITLPAAPGADATNAEIEAYNRRCGQKIAQELEDLLVEACDLGTQYNDYGFRKSFNESDFDFVYNVNAINKVLNIDMPTIFNSVPGAENLKKGTKIQALYFGKDVTSDNIGSGKVIKANGEYDSTKGTLRSRIETEFTFQGNKVHLFPGDALTSGMKIAYEGGSVSNPDFESTADVYLVDDTILGKWIHKKAIKYYIGFASDSEFWNPKNFSTNKYTTWFYSEPKKLKSYPVITIRLANS